MARRSIGAEAIEEAVYILLMLIPLGRVTTYSSLARTLGISPRTVGRILSRNRNIVVIPCHRVVMRDGRIGGYTHGGVGIKKRLLELEGVRFRGDRVDPGCVIDIAEMLGVGRRDRAPNI
jgi:methylated-DNA-[protein]-cysteine S-methyltransferase